MTNTPPDWVLIEAAKRSDWVTQGRSPHLSSWYRDNKTFRALCDMIQKYEQPPVDRKLLCACEAEREVSERNLDEDWWEAIAVRAIELWEEGFGK